MEEASIKHLMIHLDVDVFDSTFFRSTLFANPYGEKINALEGTMHLFEVGLLIETLSEKNNIVGFGITEFLPWDMINLKEMLSKTNIFHQ